MPDTKANSHPPALPGDLSGPNADIRREIAQLQSALSIKNANKQKATEYERGRSDASTQWGRNQKQFDIDIFRDAKSRQHEFSISHLEAMIAATEAMQQGFVSAVKSDYGDPYNAGLMSELNAIAQDYFSDKLHALFSAQHQQILNDESQARHDARQLALQKEQERLRADFAEMERNHHASILEQIRFAQTQNNQRMEQILSTIQRMLED